MNENKKFDLRIIYETKDLVVINKQPEVITHPGAGRHENDLMMQLINKYGPEGLSDTAGESKRGVVHRLDKGTSGLIIFAKTNHAHESLTDQIKTRQCKRYYLALCCGMFVPTRGIIETGIKPNTKKHGQMMVCALNDNKGKYAATNYITKEVFHKGDISLVEFQLQTGRTHQIRVHSSYKGHSIIGDKIYKQLNHKLSNFSPEQRNIINAFPRQALHAYKIDFLDPETNNKVSLQIEMEQDMKDLYNQLK